MKMSRMCVLVLAGAVACGDAGGDAGVDAAASGVDAEPGCELVEYAHGTDGLYEGYVACSEAHFPDFQHPTTRWDGFYSDGCAEETGTHAYACMEQLFWEATQFDYDGRLTAYGHIKALVTRVEDDPSYTVEQRARLYWRLGQLGVAIIAENGDLTPGPEVQAWMQRAHDTQPDNTIIEAWMMTVEINFIAQFGGDLEQALADLWALYERDPPGVSGTVMGIAAGMPLDTGWPDIAVQLVDDIDEDDCSVWCGWEFLRAPYALEGQYFSYAEVYARVGDRDRTEYWLGKAAASTRADTWPFKSQLDVALGDVDSFMGMFAARGETEPVTDLLISGTEGACRMCHDHLR